MTLQQSFEHWLKTDHFPEAELAQRNGVYTNPHTRDLWTGFLAGIEFNAKAQRESVYEICPHASLAGPIHPHH